MNCYQRAAGRLAWELRLRQYIPLSLRLAHELVDLDEARTLALLDCIVPCLPVVRMRCGWLQCDAPPLQPTPRNGAQRAAVVAWTLAAEPLTVRQVAVLAGLKRNSAYVMLTHLSEVLPIWEDDELWRRDVRQGVIWRAAKVD